MYTPCALVCPTQHQSLCPCGSASQTRRESAGARGIRYAARKNTAGSPPAQWATWPTRASGAARSSPPSTRGVRRYKEIILACLLFAKQRPEGSQVVAVRPVASWPPSFGNAGKGCPVSSCLRYVTALTFKYLRVFLGFRANQRRPAGGLACSSRCRMAAFLPQFSLQCGNRNVVKRRGWVMHGESLPQRPPPDRSSCTAVPCATDEYATVRGPRDRPGRADCSSGHASAA